MKKGEKEVCERERQRERDRERGGGTKRVPRTRASIPISTGI